MSVKVHSFTEKGPSFALKCIVLYQPTIQNMEFGLCSEPLEASGTGGTCSVGCFWASMWALRWIGAWSGAVVGRRVAQTVATHAGRDGEKEGR